MNNISNTELIEISVMKSCLKGLTEPKKVLEKLANTNLEMGWGKVEDIRLKTYACWLVDNNMKWYEYLKELCEMFACLQMGTIKIISDPPEGWINPKEYCLGKIPGDEK